MAACKYVEMLLLFLLILKLTNKRERICSLCLLSNVSYSVGCLITFFFFVTTSFKRFKSNLCYMKPSLLAAYKKSACGQTESLFEYFV